MHGIEVRKRPTDGLGDPKASGVWIRRVSVRYEDGRVMSFIPEAEEEYLSQDDAERLVGILRKSSAALEWGADARRISSPREGRRPYLRRGIKQPRSETRSECEV